jgi:hypothetical protein
MRLLAGSSLSMSRSCSPVGFSPIPVGVVSPTVRSASATDSHGRVSAPVALAPVRPVQPHHRGLRAPFRHPLNAPLAWLRLPRGGERPPDQRLGFLGCARPRQPGRPQAGRCAMSRQQVSLLARGPGARNPQVSRKCVPRHAGPEPWARQAARDSSPTCVLKHRIGENARIRGFKSHLLTGSKARSKASRFHLAGRQCRVRGLPWTGHLVPYLRSSRSRRIP